MFCNSCGTSNTSDALFCVSCGNRVSQSAELPKQIEHTPKTGLQISGIKLSDKKTKIALFSAGGVLVLGIVIGFASGGSAIPGAIEACGLSSNTEGISLDEDGKSVFFDGTGEEDFSGISYSDVRCVLEELNAPESIFDRIGTTTSLKGVVEGEWDNYSANWTYHPNDGLDLTLNVK
jgi:hypothetical protein